MFNGEYPRLRWLRSSRCDGGQCVEVAELADGRVAVRQSTDAGGATLTFSGHEWTVFLTALRAGELTP
jgi:hypothetical protein